MPPRPLNLFLGLTALAYIAFFLSLSNVPFMDAPSHLARAVVMNSLWFDPHSPFGIWFAVRHFFMPYMLPDLGLIAILGLFGVHFGYPIWGALTMLVLALAISFYARRLLATSWALAAAVLCSWYFATNYLLILGFLSFEWGLAAAFVALGALQSWRRNTSGAALYFVACLATYGAHTACFAILAALVGGIGVLRVLRRQQTWSRLAWEMLPFVILSAYHFWLVPAHPEAVWRSMAPSSIPNKLGRFAGSIFIRRTHFTDLPLLLLFLGIIAYSLWSAKPRRIDPDLAAVCALSAFGYFLLPIGMGAGWYVDERLLPFFFVPLLMLALRAIENSESRGRTIIVLCGVLAAGNLASLALFLPAQNREVAQYREALQTLPSGRTILPVDTIPADHRTRPLFHADSFYTVDRAGYTPYLFSAKTGGGPAGYFSDLSPIYRPDQGWYTNHENPNWQKIFATYDFVVVTKPWRVERIDRSRLAVQFENPAATVFRVLR